MKLGVTDIVQKAVNKLNFNPKKRALLMSLDLLAFGEVGLVSRELLAIIYLILQSVKCDDEGFGGVFMILNGDTNQLPKIDGSKVFLRNQILFNFKV